MKVKEMIEFLSKYNEDLDMCVVVRDYEDEYLEIAHCELDNCEGLSYIAIRVFHVN